MNTSIAKKIRIGALCSGLLIVAGCQAPAQSHSQTAPACDRDASSQNAVNKGPAVAAMAYDSASEIPLNAVTMSDDGIHRAMITQALLSERTETGTVKVAAWFMNCTNQRLAVRVRTHFLKGAVATAMPGEPVSAWRTLLLEPGTMTTYQELSLSRDIKYFVIEVGH